MLRADFDLCKIGIMVKRIGFKLIFTNIGLGKAMAKYKPDDYAQPLNPSSDLPHYYPNHKSMLLKLIADRNSRKILGFHAVGAGETVKRVDVMATAMTLGATIDDLPNIDLGYAPPYSTAIIQNLKNEK